MKSLECLVDAKGNPGTIIVLLKSGEESLKEFNKDEGLQEGSISRCFVLTAPGDIISVDINANAQTADVFDLEVDGILRASVTSKALAKAFHGTINKVCYKGKSGTKQSGAKYCGMQVKRRDESMDGTFNREGTPSAVSSLVIKAWRKTPGSTLFEAVNKATGVFTYEEYNSWKELKHHIGKDAPSPPFEIDFIESTKLGKKQRDKMDEIHKRNPEDYSFFATFVFSLQSTASLTTLGFKDVPTYTPTPPPAKPPKTKKSKKSVQAEADDEDEPEDDGASEGEEPKKKEKKPEPKQDPEPKSKSKPQPKASELKSKKSKALLSTFGPQPAGFDILNSLFPPKPKVPMSKEAGKSLSFSRSEMFSGELPVQQAVDDAPASSFNTDSQPIKYTDPVTEENSNKVKAKVADDKTQQKGLLLHGEIGGPAHRAFLARGSTQDTESQSQPQVDSMEMTIETGITAPSTSAVIDGETSAHTKDALDLIEVIQAQASLINESPEFEPLTPPVSAKKDLPQRDMESILAERLLNTSPSPISQLQPTQMSQDKPSTFSQATTASTQDCRSQLEIIHPEPSVNIDKMIKDLEALSRESEVRALSPALSEATEVAGPLEIMESVKNSQRTSHGSYQYAQSNQKSSFHEDKSSGYHTIASPTLGSAKTTREDDSMPHIKTGDVREQVRESWQYRSPTSSFSQAEKRKADAITGQERSETEQPRKTAVAPSLGRTSLEEKMMAAKAKLAAATERNRKLEEERQAALLIKKKNDEVEALLLKAEELEQSNIELEAEINSLRESNIV